MMIFSFLFYILITLVASLEYKKNKHIKLQKKEQNYTRVLDIEQSDLIQNKINLKKSNFMLIFYSHWCIHCKDLLETMDTVSSYEFTNGFDFLKVDCAKFKNICDAYKINSFPTVKVFIKGEETKSTPNGRDLEALLEYVDKINSPSIIDVENGRNILKYSEDYGDVSFLLINNNLNDEKDNLNKCYRNFAENPEYKPLFYFFTLPKNKFKNENEIKLPAIINLGINSEFNIHLSFDKDIYSLNYIKTCEVIKNFIEENKYPIIKRLDNNYLSRMQKEKKIVLISAIHKNEISHINFLNNFFHNIALRKRQYIFSYLDAKADSHLLQFFNLKSEDIPKIIIYDFSRGKHYIDKFSYLEDSNAMDKLNELIDKLNSDDIQWTTGYFFEDILSKIGINISRMNLMMLVIGLGTFILILIIMCTCNIVEKQDMKEQLKKVKDKKH